MEDLIMSADDQDKKDYWMKELGSKDRTAQQRAIESLATIGETAVPGLMELLEKAEWQVRNQAVIALGAIGPPAASP
jgi:HEAT repeat protein